MRRRKRKPTNTAASKLHRHGTGFFGCHPALDPDSRHCSIARREDGAGGLCSCLGTGLGTSKSRKAVRVPSEATPDKRDVVFDLLSHNPMVGWFRSLIVSCRVAAESKILAEKWYRLRGLTYRRIASTLVD